MKALARKPGLIPQAEYARSRKVTRQHINNLCRKGVIERFDGLVDPVQADGALRAIADPVKSAIKKSQYPGFDPALDGKTNDPDDEQKENLSEQLLRARILTEQERGRLAGLQRRKRQGQLVEASDVEAASRLRASEEREALLNFPTNYGPDMAAELNIESRLLADVLRKYVRKHLEDRSRASIRGRSADDESD